MSTPNYSEWVTNEYQQWIEALRKSDVSNFKKNPTVKRMLGEPDHAIWLDAYLRNFIGSEKTLETIIKINEIGYPDATGFEVSRVRRYIYYAQQIIQRSPESVCEIGAGVGEFFAVLRAMGYEGEYRILDLRPVRIFQDKYLTEITRRTGLDTRQSKRMGPLEMLISFYALGEFDDKCKGQFANRDIPFYKRGYIAWNPHSGATDDLSIFNAHKITITPGLEDGVKIIEW